MTDAVHSRRLVLEDPAAPNARRLLVLALRDCVSLGLWAYVMTEDGWGLAPRNRRPPDVEPVRWTADTLYAQPRRKLDGHRVVDLPALGEALGSDPDTNLIEPLARTRDQLAAAGLIERRADRWRRTPSGTAALEGSPPIPDVGRQGLGAGLSRFRTALDAALTPPSHYKPVPYDSTGGTGGASYGFG